MERHAPRTVLSTHEVRNQPPAFGNLNLYLTDPALRDAARRAGGERVDMPLAALGAEAGSAEMLEHGELANRNPPELLSFDRWGRRIDEVRFHPSYHVLMEWAMRHRIHSVAWRTTGPGGHVVHAALLALATQAEAGTMCPVSMTYASVPVLQTEPALAASWLSKIIDGRYDAPLRPIAGKAGVTVGMAMTEKQGGSDLRATVTTAQPDGAGGWRLRGHKWFCSAPMSDAFLTLAQLPEGLTCFLAPRIAPDGERNEIQLMRLKDKLGNRSNASAEIEYHDAHATMIGEPGRGVATLIDMVHHTRLDTVAGTLGIMRRALAEAAHHVTHRRAFGKRLLDQPVMRAVIADLALEYEAACALAMHVARAFDGGAPETRSFARLSVALAKFWIGKRAPHFTFECMECLGGAGYVEEAPLARLYREAPLNSIWEGSGNVIALDLLRTLQRDRLALDAFRDEIAMARGQDGRLDAAADALWRDLGRDLDASGRDAPGEAITEATARWLAERMALLLQAALLVRSGEHAVADAFCATRIAGEGGRGTGALPAGLDTDALVRRVFAG